MPVHALVGHIAAAVTPLAALMALIYAAVPHVRRGLRWATLLALVVASATCVWAASEGSPLLAQLKPSWGGTTPPVTHSHIDQSGYMAGATVTLTIVLLAVVWRWLSPGRPRSSGSLISAALVVVCAVATLWFTGTTVHDAVGSVWSHHSVWKA